MSIYHSARGTNSYTIVGTPTVINNIVSNCNNSNYIKIDSYIYANVIDEIGIKIRKNLVSSTAVFFQIREDTTFQLFYNSTSIWLGCYNSETAPGNAVIIGTTDSNNAPDGHDYWIKITSKNNVVSLYISTDGQNYILTDSKEVVYNSSIGSYYIDIFKNDVNSSNSVDLNQTYIRVNNTAWFGICPLKVKKHQVIGPVGYTVQGSPTISDGIVSNFSASNFLQSTSLFDSASAFDNLEVQTKITVPTDISSSGQQILYFPFEGLYSGFRIYANNAVSWYIFSNRITIDSGFVMTPGNSYFIKATMINKIATLYIKEEGQSWQSYGTADCSEENPTANEPFIIGTFGSDHSHYFTGSIDLNQTYIKINDKVWFYQPQPTKYIIKDSNLIWSDPNLYLSGPVDYTSVGSVVVKDNIASNFSSSNYLLISEKFDRNIYNAFMINSEFLIKLNLSTIPTSGICHIFYIPSGGEYAGLFLRTNGRITWQIYSTTYRVEPEYPRLTANQDYWIKGIISNNTASLYRSQDGSSFELMGSKDLTDIPDGYSYANPQIGYHASDLNAFPGSVDLTETYIKINNQLWFYGKIYASDNIIPVPANFTYGSTTTSSIGYVNVKTQTFTASPQGTTISR